MPVTKENKKTVALFEPSEPVRSQIEGLIRQMGFHVIALSSDEDIPTLMLGPSAADLLIVNLSLLAPAYQEILERLHFFGLNQKNHSPWLTLTNLNLSEEARERIKSLGVHDVLSQDAPWLELLFAVNRILFHKIRELRRYTRVFGGFPVQFSHENRWQQGEVYNISEQGAFIRCDHPVRENARISIRFLLPEANLSVDVQGLVNWVNDTPGNPFSPVGMGVSFLTLSEEESRTLRDFIARRSDETSSSA
jgi:hypothetical protein